jgi:putative membrane protein
MLLRRHRARVGSALRTTQEARLGTWPARHTVMTKLTNIGTLSLIALLGSCVAVACGDDDDNGGANGAGRAGSSHAGSSNGGTNNNNGGAPIGEGGEPGGPSRAGTAGRGGTTSTGGTLAAAGAEQGGMGGAAGDMAAAGAGGQSAVASLSDAQILLVLDTLNQGEVEEAYAALPRLTSAPVKSFAQEMVMDHGMARQSVLTTANALNLAPTPSQPQAELQGEGEAHVALLRAASASALDATYVSLEVDGHAEALALLDDLATAADAAQLKTLISMLRATVLQHYQQAQALKAAL